MVGSLRSILIYEMERKGHTNADIDSVYGRQYQFERERYNHACDVNGIMIELLLYYLFVHFKEMGNNITGLRVGHTRDELEREHEECNCQVNALSESSLFF